MSRSDQKMIFFVMVEFILLTRTFLKEVTLFFLKMIDTFLKGAERMP